ncbi:MAG: hypothetical protein KUG73_03785, partial [Pseudomonadales bacterium]|nr:hypothetical protein [Pseudomonadales bacterium]
AKNDLTITATDNQANLLERLNSLEINLAKLPNIPDYDAERDRFRVIRGVLMWDLNETAIERRWERTKDKVFIEGQLELLEQRIQRVIAARGTHLEHYGEFKTRIAKLDKRLNQLQEKSLRAILHHRAYLKTIAKNIITQHQQHVRNLQANTLFSIARLQDIAYIQEQERNFQPGVQTQSKEGSLENATSTDTKNDFPTESTASPATESGALPTTNDNVRVPFEVEERKSLFEGGFKSIFGIWD